MICFLYALFFCTLLLYTLLLCTLLLCTLLLCTLLLCTLLLCSLLFWPNLLCPLGVSTLFPMIALRSSPKNHIQQIPFPKASGTTRRLIILLRIPSWLLALALSELLVRLTLLPLELIGQAGLIETLSSVRDGAAGNRMLCVLGILIWMRVVFDLVMVQDVRATELACLLGATPWVVACR